MATQKVLVIDATSGLRKEYTPLLTSAGSGSSGNIPALDSTGRLDVSFMPVGIGPEVLIMNTTDTLTAGMYVTIYNNSGTVACKKADSTDNTKPAHGFVLSAFTSGTNATVYKQGMNTVIPVGSFVAANLGSPLFLGTGGAVTLTPPATTGNLLQVLGIVDAVGGTVTSNFLYESGVVRG